jgi:hypothetical protein
MVFDALHGLTRAVYAHVMGGKILHFNVTRNPHTLWVVQQLREAWEERS